MFTCVNKYTWHHATHIYMILFLLSTILDYTESINSTMYTDWKHLCSYKSLIHWTQIISFYICIYVWNLTVHPKFSSIRYLDLNYSTGVYSKHFTLAKVILRSENVLLCARCILSFFSETFGIFSSGLLRCHV